MRVITAAQLEPLVAPVALPRAPYAVTFAFAGVTVELRTTQPHLAEEIQRRFCAHVTGEPAALRYLVWETESGYVFCSADGAGWRWNEGALPVGALAFLTDAALIAAVVRADRALRSAHAAAFSHNGIGAILAGDTTSGKTTTLLACARAGMRVFSDERALLRGDRLYPFLRRCGVREGGRRLLLADDASDALARELRFREHVDLSACFGAEAIADPVPMRAAFVLHARGPRPSARRIGATDVFPAVARWFDMRGDAMERLSCALSLLRRCRCFALTLGPPGETAAAIRRALEAPA
jgi:hypothetical protein